MIIMLSDYINFLTEKTSNWEVENWFSNRSYIRPKIQQYCTVWFNVPTIYYKYLGVYEFSTYSLFLQGNSDDFVNEAESEDENK